MFSSNTSQVSADANFIEDVFSTYLYTGNGTSQTITNGIDLSGKGGLVWTKGRSAAQPNSLFDTARGATKQLLSSSADPTNTAATSLTAFNSNGFSLGMYGDVNSNGTTMVSWTFREQAKFFDVVTYTGNGVSGRTISHSLGAAPGCIIVKRLDLSASWRVYHQSNGATKYLTLNSDVAAQTASTVWFDTAPTSTVFTVGGDAGVNANGGTYVAYLFAHNAGGFGLTGTDNVISCGSYVGNGSTTGPTVTLGYEPQWVMVKATSAASNWSMFDNMRGVVTGGNDDDLYANLTYVGPSGIDFIDFTATGFVPKSNTSDSNGSGVTYIYIAIRRGPMKTPTSGTSVFTPTARAGTGATATFTGAGFPVDLSIIKQRDQANSPGWEDRLRGANRVLESSAASAEVTTTQFITSFASMNGYTLGTNSGVNASGATYINWDFRRAPGFFDVLCYTGTSGVAQNINHNLGVVPELIIVKSRSARSWPIYAAPQGNQWSGTLDSTFRGNTGSSDWNATTPTASVFSVGVANATNTSENYVAYLFATCPGVSKVGSYTGTGTTLQVNCGFTAGARWVMIKRTDTTGGSWYVWDSARGIVAGNDPYLLLNSGAAEVTNTDYVDTFASGFEISSTAPAEINANGGTFIFLAIA